MNSYLIGGYVIGFALLWGYAVMLFIESRSIGKMERARGEVNTSGQG